MVSKDKAFHRVWKEGPPQRRNPVPKRLSPKGWIFMAEACITVPQTTDSGAVRGIITALRGRYGFLDALPVGRSAVGREIMGLVLGNGRERVLMAAAFHGQEWLTALVTLRLCEEICRGIALDVRLDDWELRRALAGRCLILVPMVNPDGVDIAIHGSAAAGPYAALVSRLGGDCPGRWQANARGVDINHNFNAGWCELHEQEREAGICGPGPRRWGGPDPESESETRAMVGLCRRCRFRHVIALHSQGEEIYWEYGPRTPERSRLMAEILASASGYTVARPEGLASAGGFKDWFISDMGRPGFTIELGKGENPLPLSDFESLYQKAREMLLLALMM